MTKDEKKLEQLLDEENVSFETTTGSDFKLRRGFVRRMGLKVGLRLSPEEGEKLLMGDYKEQLEEQRKQ